MSVLGLNDLVYLGVLTTSNSSLFTLCVRHFCSLQKITGLFLFAAVKVTFHLCASLSVSICVHPYAFYHDRGCDWVASTSTQQRACVQQALQTLLN